MSNGNGKYWTIDRLGMALLTFVAVGIMATQTYVIYIQRQAADDQAERFERSMEAQQDETTRLLEGIKASINGQTCVLGLEPANRSQENIDACFMAADEPPPSTPEQPTTTTTSTTTTTKPRPTTTADP